MSVSYQSDIPKTRSHRHFITVYPRPFPAQGHPFVQH